MYLFIKYNNLNSSCYQLNLKKAKGKLSKVKNNIIRFHEENNMDDINTLRNYYKYYNEQKGPCRETYLTSKSTTLQACKAAHKGLYGECDQIGWNGEGRTFTIDYQ